MKNEISTKKGLNNLPQYEPKPEAWDQIENALERDSKPKIAYFRWGMGIAATLAMLLSISFLLRNGVSEEVKMADSSTVQSMSEKNEKVLDVILQDSNTPLNVSEIDDETPVLKYQIAVVDSNTSSSTSGTILSVADSTISFQNNAFISGIDIGTYSLDFTQSSSYDLSAPSFQNVYTMPDQMEYTVELSNVGTADNWTLNYSPGEIGVQPDLYYDPSLADDLFKAEENYEIIDYDGVVDYEESAEDIEIPFERNLLSEKYQTTITDSIHFQNHSAHYSTEPINTESYAPLVENEYKSPKKDPLSTFGIDVDNASYTVMRTKINSGLYVPKDAVRVEEFVNYFGYSYPKPTNNDPFSVNMEMASCPWNAEHQLVRIGLKGKEIDYENLSASNLVFLIDVSGSMSSENKLSLVKKSLKLLVDQMGEHDRIAVVTYAGSAGLAVPSTACNEKEEIKKKIDKLDAGGSTAGGQGIALAYKVAIDNFLEKGNNRVILCTDGDFNVGASSDKAMKDLIIENRNKGVFVTVCGFGMGNYQDSKMETIADNGNGNYFYIDNFKEATRIFERDIRATLFTIAKDVKIQVEFNPKHVKGYRLIGYENRIMPPQDFNDDTKDGGELGAGHTVTALYEIIPAGSKEGLTGLKELKYQMPKPQLSDKFGDEILSIQLRHKEPRSDVSTLIESTLNYTQRDFNSASEDFRFAAGIALFSQQLRQSKFVEKQDFSQARSIVANSMSKGEEEKTELLYLIDQASKIYHQTTQKD